VSPEGDPELTPAPAVTEKIGLGESIFDGDFAFLAGRVGGGVAARQTIPSRARGR
jgi:hypothetical protein